MALSDSEIKDLALLARLGLTVEERAAMGQDLSSVLGFFRELEEYAILENPEDVVSSPGKARSDTADPCPPETRDAIKKNFPTSKDNYLKVRSVF